MKKINLLLIFFLTTLFILNGIFASSLNLLFEVNALEDNSLKDKNIISQVPSFSNFSVELISIYLDPKNYISIPEDNFGFSSYNLTIKLLDSSKKPITDYTAPLVLTSFTDPPISINQTKIQVAFGYNSSAKYIDVLYGGKVIFEKNMEGLFCNYNDVCENEYTNYSNLFENYITCPSDCNLFERDGLCTTSPLVDYSFNDHYCDSDCNFDLELSGDCNIPNCNDNLLNQDETNLDCGGICSLCKNCFSFENYTSFNNQVFNNACIDETHLLTYSCGINLFQNAFGGHFFDAFSYKSLQSSTQICDYGCLDGACKDAPPVICGDEICSDGEDCSICPIDCGGCAFPTGLCDKTGARATFDSIIFYCDISENYIRVKLDGETCDNNFECLNNLCSAGKCVNLYTEVKDNKNLAETVDTNANN